MPSVVFDQNIRALGSTIAASVTRTADGGVSLEVVVPHGHTGTLSTRTDNETGTLTMDPGHGITTGQTIDLYWTGGIRYGVLVGTVSSNTVPIGADNGGSGSNLPIATTAIVAAVPVSFDVAISSTGIKFFATQMVHADSSVTTHSKLTALGFADDSSFVVTTISLEPGTPKLVDVTGGDTNIFVSGNVVGGNISNPSSASDATLKLLVIQDATP